MPAGRCCANTSLSWPRFTRSARSSSTGPSRPWIASPYSPRRSASSTRYRCATGQTRAMNSTHVASASAAEAMSPIPASGFSPSTSRATSRMRSRVSFIERTREDSVGTTPLLHTSVQQCRLHTSVQRRVALCFEAQEKKAMTAPTPPTSTLFRPFTVSISDSEIDDVKQRLARTRWPDPETVGDWSQGVRVENARSLVDHWERGYDWRRFESELNRFPQFLTEIDGLD